MADKLEIRHPKPNKKVRPNFAVVGRAQGNITSIKFELTNAGVQLGGTSYFKAGGPGKPSHWVIVVKNAPQATLKLTVRGLNAAGTVLDTVTRDIEVAVPKKGPMASRGTPALDIWYPQEGDNITAEAGDFIAYGPCSSNIEVRISKDTTPGVVADAYFFGDFWVGQFPAMTVANVSQSFIVKEDTGSSKAIQVTL